MSSFKIGVFVLVLSLVGLSKQDAYAPPILTIKEWEVTTLNCQPGYEISVTWGFYGKQGTDCVSASTLQVLKQRCDGLRSCGMEAVNTNFGDPCHGEGKTLSILYRCVQVK